VQVTYLPTGEAVSVPAGTTIFTAAHLIGVRVDATCGGLGTCGRCEVEVTEGRADPSPRDREHLPADRLAAGWRLACRTRADRDLVCRVPEPMGAPQVVMAGAGRPVYLEPAVQKVLVELAEASPSDTRSELERIEHDLRQAGFGVQGAPSSLQELPVPGELGGSPQRAGRRVTAVLCGEHFIAVEPGDTRETVFGVAFDIGTTTVVGALVDLHSGAVTGVAAELNRQAVFGADVISRLGHTMTSDKGTAQLQRLVLSTLNDILAALYRQSGVTRERVYEAVCVGNATMLHLLLGVEAHSIAVAPFTPAFRDPVDLGAARLGLDIHPEGRLQTLPLVGAYVGADTVAGLHATALAEQERLRLFIDVGTNSEIALGSKDRMLVTAAPAGPAFEGGRIDCGMTARAGAAERVRLGRTVELSVIGGGAARGLCGSGLIDLVAQLRLAGIVDATGRMMSPTDLTGHPLVDRVEAGDRMLSFRLTDELVLTQWDVRELQSARGAVATGIDILMEELGVSAEDLDEVVLAGAFGTSLDPRSAIAFGLVPPVSPEIIRSVGNVAIEGAKMALMSFRERQAAFVLPARVEYLELSARPDFNERFVSSLEFPEVEPWS
jgi:uncharacterized 2Fe-2S/4Fe-4S cluster protein (DUF4445 family)